MPWQCYGCGEEIERPAKCACERKAVAKIIPLEEIEAGMEKEAKARAAESWLSDSEILIFVDGHLAGARDQVEQLKLRDEEIKKLRQMFSPIEKLKSSQVRNLPPEVSDALWRVADDLLVYDEGRQALKGSE